MKRVFATLVFFLTHIAYYLIFSQFLSGKWLAIMVYSFTVVTFVILDGFLMKVGGRREK